VRRLRVKESEGSLPHSQKPATCLYHKTTLLATLKGEQHMLQSGRGKKQAEPVVQFKVLPET
jgi:hypothetical protein